MKLLPSFHETIDKTLSLKLLNLFSLTTPQINNIIKLYYFPESQSFALLLLFQKISTPREHGPPKLYTAGPCKISIFLSDTQSLV